MGGQVDVQGQLAAIVGDQLLTLTDRAGTAGGYQVVTRYNVPTSAAPRPAQPLGVHLAYDRNKLSVGDSLSVRASVTNHQDATAPMVLVELPIPAGFAIDPTQLDGWRSDQRIARYQLTAGSVIVYLRELAPNAQIEMVYRLSASTPLRVTAPAATAYEYYNPDVRATGETTLLEVEAN